MDKRAVPPTARKKIIEFDPEGAPRGSVTRLCEELGITRAAFYKIRKQAAASPDDPGSALLPAKSGPAAHPSVISPAMEAALVAKRAWLAARGWDHGPASVRARLLRDGMTDVPSRATIARLFARLGLSKREPSKRPRSSYRRFRWPRANDMWQLDGTEVRLDDQAGSKRVVYQVEDDHSRMVLAWAVDRSENSRTAIAVVSAAVDRFGAPLRFLTDNGLAFNMSRRGSTAPLETWLKIKGVEPATGRPGKPTTQGKNERLHRTLKQFLDAHRPIGTEGELRSLVAEFTHGYNHDRPHQELEHGRTPADAYQAATKAPSPLPPAGTASGQPAASPQAVYSPPAPPQPLPQPRAKRSARPTDTATGADATVRPNAQVFALGCRIYIGATHCGELIHLIQHQGLIWAYDQDGVCIGWTARPPRKPRTTNPPYTTLKPYQPGQEPPQTPTRP